VSGSGGPGGTGFATGATPRAYGPLVRLAARLSTLPLALLLLASGVVLLLDQAADAPGLEFMRPVSRPVRAWTRAVENAGGRVPAEWIARSRASGVGSIPGFVLIPCGLVLLAFSTGLVGVGRGGRSQAETSAAPGGEVAPLDAQKRNARKIRKQARSLVKQGEPVEAAELLWSHDLLDEAAALFIEIQAFVRAAEIRHDQNRFLEAAELHVQAENYEAAGSIFSQQEEWGRAADCYLKCDHKSVAAEMFEKAGRHREAADCYRETDFLRHAAAMYVQCHAWRSAAECLETVFVDEGGTSGLDPKKAADMSKLVRQAGRLFLKAEDPDRALAIFVRGGCSAEAGEVASLLGDQEAAAQHYRQANEVEKAAAALRKAGQHAEAARLLGQHLRDVGRIEEAAALLEEAGDLLEAGDLYRTLERYEEAARCYESQNGFEAAAEMHGLAGNRSTAGEAYARAGLFTEAAESFALAGESEREAEMLAQAGERLRAGSLYHQAGRDEEAISILQQIEPDHADYARAAALLGDLFAARGQAALAIGKLGEALGGGTLSRENVEGYYKLAALHEEQGQLREAADLYQKVLAFDYHFADVEARLASIRAALPGEDLSVLSASAAGRSTGAPSFDMSADDDRYQIVGELGRGGMGIVYKVQDTVLDRLVAFKVLPRAFSENAQAIQNFLREAQAAAKLNHPNIVTVYDTGERMGRFFITMEYVEGTTIKEILRRRGPISQSGILHVLMQMSEALAYAHEKKVVHRDIKPANAMWTREKKVKLMDFGLAKVVEEARNHTTVVAGTPYYMSPEQTLGRNVDHRTDIYSLGVSLFEMATGTVPFREGNIPYHHVHTVPPHVRDLRPELSETLARVVDRCLQKDPADRYQSAREILTEVRRALAQGTGRAGLEATNE